MACLFLCLIQLYFILLLWSCLFEGNWHPSQENSCFLSESSSYSPLGMLEMEQPWSLWKPVRYLQITCARNGFKSFRLISLMKLQPWLFNWNHWNGLPSLKVLVTQFCPTCATPWTIARQAPLSMEFSRQEYWSGLPFPSPRDLPDPGVRFGSPTLWADSLPYELPAKPSLNSLLYQKLIYHRGDRFRTGATPGSSSSPLEEGPHMWLFMHLSSSVPKDSQDYTRPAHSPSNRGCQVGKRESFLTAAISSRGILLPLVMWTLYFVMECVDCSLKHRFFSFIETRNQVFMKKLKSASQEMI